MRMIQFGSENGSTKAGDTIWPYQLKLNKIFYSDDLEASEATTLEGMSIVFRVSGKTKISTGRDQSV